MRKSLKMALLLSMLLGGYGTVSANVAALTTNYDNRNISVNTNSGSVEITLSGTAKDPKQTALGNGAKATGNLATAIGAEAEATEQTSTALGNAAKAKGVNATAVGHGAYATLGGSALGHFAYARGDHSVAFGFEAQTGTDGTPADGTEAIAIGYSAKAQKQKAIVIGSGARAEEEGATALGYNTVARGKNALALGYNARAHLENSVAIGYNSSVGAVNSVSFGSSGATRRLMYVSAGESETDAANFGQLLKSASLNGSKLEFYTNAFKKSFEVDLSSLSGGGGAGGTVISGGNVAYDATGNGTLTLKSGTGTVASIAGLTDKYTTGVELTGNTVTFTRNDGGAYSFELPASAGAGGTVISGGTVAYDATGNGTLTLKSGTGTVASIAGLTDKYTTGVELTGNTVTFTRNDGGTYSFELPASAGAGGGMSSLQFAGDDGTVITKTNGQQLAILGGAPLTALSEKNIGVVSESGALKIKLAKNIQGISSLTTESGVKIDAAGLNAGNKKITGVADGTDPSDAVTVGQLNKAVGLSVNTIDAGLKAANSRITSMDSKVNKVGAGAAALAALHPQDYDSSAKWDVAAGFGNYRNSNAAAIGLFYRPNPDMMFSVGTNFGNGENMVNFGVSVKLGKSSPYAAMSKAQLVDTVEKQNEKIERIEAQLRVMMEKMDAMQEK